MSINIKNYNDNGQMHGYQEWYLVGSLWFKCFYNNGIAINYVEYYWGGELEKYFYI